MAKVVDKLINSLNPNVSSGKTLLVLNALGMAFAALSNTFAAAKDKNTSAEDKKFLIPAGLVTGVANIGIYFGMTKKMIDGFENSAKNAIKNLSDEDIVKKSLEFANKQILKKEKGFLGTGLFKKSPEYIQSMKTNLLKDGKPTEVAKQLFKDNVKSGAGVIAAFIGAIVGSAIITPIIRDVSAYIVQKRIEKQKPHLQEQPYFPYFDPTHVGMGPHGKFDNVVAKKQPLSMKNYMAFTNGRTKI